MCKYDFVSKLNSSAVSGSNGSINAAPNCTAAIIAAATNSPLFGKGAPSSLKVTAVPNPFTSQVNFRFVSPVTGKATLEVYNLLGQKLAIVYNGDVKAGAEISVQYNVPADHRVPMIYKLSVDDQGFRGTLIPIK